MREERGVGGKGLEEMRDGGRRCLSQANALQTIYTLFEGTDGFLKGTNLFLFLSFLLSCLFLMYMLVTFPYYNQGTEHINW
jgi:hypothetical protein